MAAENRISVITSVYNGEKTIEHTILSVLKQDYGNYELIIVDGLSEDRTMEVVHKYASIDDRIRFLSEKDSGIYDAFNKGIQLSSGQIVAFINADDFLAPEALQIVNSSFDLNRYSIFAASLTIINESDMYSKRIYRSKINEHSLTNPVVLTIGCCFKKEIFYETGFFDHTYRICADVDFIYRCLNQGVNIQYSDILLSFMRQGGISSNVKFELLKKKEQLRAHIQNSEQVDLKYTLSLCVKLFKTLFLNTLFKSRLNRLKRISQDFYIPREIFWFLQ